MLNLVVAAAGVYPDEAGGRHWGLVIGDLRLKRLGLATPVILRSLEATKDLCICVEEQNAGILRGAQNDDGSRPATRDHNFCDVCGAEATLLRKGTNLFVPKSDGARCRL